MRRQIKVCGMRQLEQMKELEDLHVDLLGMIFYEKSPRYVQFDKGQRLLLRTIETPKVGVFVNEQIDRIQRIVSDYKLDFVQLHGGEVPEYCQELKKSIKETRIIKVFSVTEEMDFGPCKDFMDSADLFLFDTSSPNYGGSGRKFSWELLSKYQLDKPFFLSGGLRLGDEEVVNRFNHKQLLGLDLNSGFEIEPADKNLASIAQFIKKVA
jgi:phosphoribosylanthranilate isomerase